VNGANDAVMMAPPDSDAAPRALLAAFAFGAAALVAVAVLLVLGLRDTGPKGIVVSPQRAATAAAAGVKAPAHSASSSAEVPPGQLFARTSFWNDRLPATSPLDPSSAALVGALVGEVQLERTAGIGPWIGTGSGSTPVYRVPATQARVRVRLSSGSVRGRRALQRAFAAVPLPPSARPAPGADRHLTVWQPSSDRLWELFGARHDKDGWHARWGGAIRRVSRSPGYYTAAAWPGATRNWGATASSLPVIGGTMLLDDLKAGRIDHALAINLPAPRTGVFAWPAQRTDGTGPSTALPEGARLRLDPSLDVGSLHLPKLTRMIARAAQRYGLVVRDQTHHAISLFGEVPTSSRTHAYQTYFSGKTPGQLLARFPWDRLQVLRMHLCTAAPCRAA
jgi:hypothetical protein